MSTRVLYLHGLAEIGGAERDLLSLVTRLDRKKWEPLVACPQHGPLSDELHALGIVVSPMIFPAWRKLLHVFKRIPSWLKLRRLLKSEQIGLLHVNDLWWAPQGYLAARSLGIPCVVTVRQHLEHRNVHRYALDKADMVLTVSERSRSVAIEAGVPVQRVRTLYSGIDAEFFHPDGDGASIRARLGIAAQSPVIGCVANLLNIKGQDLLIQSLPAVSAEFPDVQCLFVGRGDADMIRRLRLLAVQQGVANRLHFVGFQSDVRPYVEAMDVVVLPSRAEALGIALLEAMAMGKAVVATNVGGIPEAVEHDVTGLLVPPEAPAAMGATLIKLLCHADERAALGRAGRARVLERFTVQRSIATVQQIYEEQIQHVAA
jgi:glycosyltransferase involved in cell wall biosynthesis